MSLSASKLMVVVERGLDRVELSYLYYRAKPNLYALLGWSIDASRYNCFVSLGCDEQYGRKHDISNHLILATQDTGWIELYPLGTVNSDVGRRDCR